MEIIIFAVFIEAMWETLKMIFQDGKFSKDRLGAIILSVIFTFAYQIDIFAIAGMQSAIPYVGLFGTGIIISRGANFVHDLLNAVEKNVYHK